MLLSRFNLLPYLRYDRYWLGNHDTLQLFFFFYMSLWKRFHAAFFCRTWCFGLIGDFTSKVLHTMSIFLIKLRWSSFPFLANSKSATKKIVYMFTLGIFYLYKTLNFHWNTVDFGLWTLLSFSLLIGVMRITFLLIIQSQQLFTIHHVWHEMFQSTCVHYNQPLLSLEVICANGIWHIPIWK